MKQITYEEAKKAFLRIRNGNDDFDLVEIVLDFMYQYKPPTFDEVVKAWEKAGYSDIGYKKEYDSFYIFGHKELMPMHIFIHGVDFIDTYDEYSISIEMLNAINLTIRYLQAQDFKSIKP